MRANTRGRDNIARLVISKRVIQPSESSQLSESLEESSESSEASESDSDNISDSDSKRVPLGVIRATLENSEEVADKSDYEGIGFTVNQIVTLILAEDPQFEERRLRVINKGFDKKL